METNLERLTVKEVMTHLVATFRPSDSLAEAAKRMTRNRISGGPVVVGGQVVGVLSETDIARACVPNGPWDQPEFVRDPIGFVVHRKMHEVTGDHLKVGDVMTDRVLSIGPEASIAEAAQMLDRYSIRRLPVVAEDGFLVGVLARADIVRAVAMSDLAHQAAS